MRADRLLSILLILQRQNRTTAGELAHRLEVSERTIYRDMEALSAAGIPVVAQQGKGGGWYLLDEYRVALNGLSEAESRALFLAPPRLLADLGLHEASRAAQIKLSAALPARHYQDAEFVRQRIHIDTAGWRRAVEDLSALPVLQEAIWQERRVILHYRRGEEVVERTIDPLGLVAKGSIWYLVARVAEQLRTYRVSRISAVTVAEESFERPADFDLAAHWAASTATFVANLPRYPVVVRARPETVEQLHRAGYYSRVERIGLPEPDGWLRVELCFEIEEDACGCLLRFADQLEVLEPVALRIKLVEMAERVVTFYRSLEQRNETDAFKMS